MVSGLFVTFLHCWGYSLRPHTVLLSSSQSPFFTLWITETLQKLVRLLKCDGLEVDKILSSYSFIYSFIRSFIHSFGFIRQVSLCSPGHPRTHPVDQADLKLRDSTSWVLGLKVWATLPSCCFSFSLVKCLLCKYETWVQIPAPHKKYGVYNLRAVEKVLGTCWPNPGTLASALSKTHDRLVIENTQCPPQASTCAHRYVNTHTLQRKGGNKCSPLCGVTSQNALIKHKDSEEIDKWWSQEAWGPSKPSFCVCSLTRYCQT